jgi:DNA-binding LacI/PurR family transcriptional regulator
MVAVAEHLVQVHKRRRFLFLAGPIRHGESVAREREFQDHLKSLLGSHFECAVEYCNFQEEEAWEATARHFFKGKAFDAVVAANDLMAMGALRALAEAGVKVGEDVSVTGFDDTEDSRFSIPPLRLCQ